MVAYARTAVFGIVLAAALVLAVGSAQAVQVTGSITASDPVRTQGLVAAGASSCASTPLTTVFNANTHYDAYTFQNTSASSQCVTVSFTASQSAFGTAYLGSFNPANATQNLLGFSFGCNTSASFSFNVAAQSTFVVVLEECSTGQGVSSYTMDVTGTGVVLPVTFVSASAKRTAKGVLVRWRTGTEVGTLGFNVYRQQGARRVRVNRRLLPALGAIAGSSYSYRDRRAPRHRALRYWLQDVAVDGTRTWHGPVSVSGA